MDASDQNPSLAELGWDDAWANELSTLADSRPLVAARVVRTDRGRVIVATGEGLLNVAISGPATTGDWLALDTSAGTDPEMVAVLPRRSLLSRSDANRPAGNQLLAANVDLTFVVAGLDQDVNPRRLERFLVLAWDGGTRPVIVLTKSDLVDDPTEVLVTANEVSAGAEVMLVSTATGAGLDDVAALLRPHRTAVLLGPSGAGKSTLTNFLVGENLLATNEVRATDAKGRHTTTARQLVVIPTGGVIIDTPGLRGVGVWADEESLAMAFPEIDELAGQCRFSDCSHEQEPGCAVLAAVASGVLDADRVEGWHRIQKELAALDRRRDTAAQRDYDRQFASRKMLRDAYRLKGRPPP